jgi:hypothetical protein
VLHLVGPGWVLDSLADLACQQQQQQQQHMRQAVVRRQNELLHEPAVMFVPDQQQQQQQQELEAVADGGVTVGVVAAADIRRWPWQDVGLSAGGGGGSSSDSAGKFRT